MRVTSYREVRAVLQRPEVSEMLLHRAEPPLMPIGEDVYYLRPGDAGMMLFIRRNGYFETHALMLPEDHPVKPKIEAAFAWMRENAGATEFRGPIRKDHRKARAMAHMVGMTPVNVAGNFVEYVGN